MKAFTQSLAFLIIAVSAVALINESHAAPRREAKSDVFMKRYCLYVNARLSGLERAKAAIKNLIHTLESLNADFYDIQKSIKPPSLQCLDTLNFGDVRVSKPNVDALLACFNGLMPTITYPTLDQATQCLNHLIPSYSLKYPTSFDPRACLPGVTLPNLEEIIDELYEQLEAVIAAMREVIAALRKIDAVLDRYIDPALLAHLKALAQMCGLAKLRSRVRAPK